MSITAPTLSGHTFNNLGPLTTTFAAPASCATLTNNVLYRSGTLGGAHFVSPDCNIKTSTLGDCIPSGQQRDDQLEKYAGPTLSAVANGRFNYFSPGIACPSDWTTAGVATKDSAGSLTSSGIFTPLVPFFAPDLYPPNIFIEAMAPDQTAVLCCPSGWKGDGYRCSSALSSFREFSTGCNFAIPPEDVTFYHTTYTEPGSTTGAIGDIYTMTHTAPASETIVTTFESWEIADWAPVTALPILALLHRASDLSDTATTTSTSGTSARPGFSFLLAAGMGLLGSVAAVSGGLPF